MTVDTRKVTQRREVHYDSFDDLLADAERLAGGETMTVGNWTLGQIFEHPNTTTEEGLAMLRAAIERNKNESSRAEHVAMAS